MSDYVVKIQTIKRPVTILFVFIWDIMLSVVVIKAEPFELIYLLGIGIGLLLTFIVVKQLFFQLQIHITSDMLLFRTLIFNLPVCTNTYLLKDISDLHIMRDVKENTFWGGKGWRIYDKTPIVLAFRYKNRLVQEGITYNWINIDETIKEIKKRKKD